MVASLPLLVVAWRSEPKGLLVRELLSSFQTSSLTGELDFAVMNEAMNDAARLDMLCSNTLRTLPIDAVQQAKSGHPGTPMGMAPTAYCLWQRFLRYDPNDPDWPNRDRFVLSAGHACALLYSLLYLCGVKAAGESYETTDRLAGSDARRPQDFRKLYEVPVGFKWFVQGLLDGSLGFCGKESAGAAFLRRDGSVWTTDKDGITAALLSAEITACTGRDPGALYANLAQEFGSPVADRVNAPATAQQKARLAALLPQQVASTELAREQIESLLGMAPGNSAPIGGIKVIAASGWFAARPSGTEDIYKIYAESCKGPEHLQRILKEAQAIVDAAISPTSASPVTSAGRSP